MRTVSAGSFLPSSRPDARPVPVATTSPQACPRRNHLAATTSPTMPGANNMRDKKSGGSKHKFISKKTKKREKADEEAKQKAKDDSGGASKQPRAPPLGEGNLRVLLLGEGDFSFAAALAYTWAASAGDCDSVTATTLGTEASTLALKGAVLCGNQGRCGLGASAIQAAGWPRLAEARRSLDPALAEASGEPAGRGMSHGVSDPRC